MPNLREAQNELEELLWSAIAAAYPVAIHKNPGGPSLSCISFAFTRSLAEYEELCRKNERNWEFIQALHEEMQHFECFQRICDLNRILMRAGRVWIKIQVNPPEFNAADLDFLHRLSRGEAA